jgi:hypothetical protein
MFRKALGVEPEKARKNLKKMKNKNKERKTENIIENKKNEEWK